MSSDLPHGWQWQPLESLCSRVSVGHVGETSQFFSDRSGVTFLRSQNVRPGQVDLSDVKFITPEFHRQSKKSQLFAGDLMIVRVGQNRSDCAVLPEGLGEVNCANIVFARPDRRYSDFLGFFFNSQVGRSALLAVSSGSAQLVLNTKAVAKVLVPVPPPEEAVRIGALLKTFSDRIALLRETNATLEAIAQALFKSWFVDFAPVHARARGEQAEGLPDPIAALFPDSFEESPLGLVPRGWRVVTVDDLCSQVTNGGTPSRSKSEFWESGTIPWFKTGEFADGFLLESGEKITEAGVAGSSVKVLPENAVLMAIYAAPTVGRLGVLTAPATFNQACTGMVAKPEVGPWFLFLTLLFGRDWFNSRANGAAQQNISKAIVSGYSVILPSEAVLAAFNDLATGLFAKIRAGSEQAQTLATLRDTLLPWLISGQLRLPEAKALAEGDV